MRKSAIAVASVLLLSSSLLASSDIWFDPPNPNSHSDVIAHVRVPQGCPMGSVSVQKAFPAITIGIAGGAPCGSPVALTDVPVDLGVLPAGVYTVNSTATANPTMLVIRDADTQLHISPDVGLSGELATLTAPGLGSPCTAANCTLPMVVFGKRIALVEQSIAPDTIMVRVPPEGPGIVDIRATNGGQTYTATAAFEYFTEPDPFFFEPVLFPVIISGPGAYGSLWSTEVSMHNDSPNQFEVDNPVFGKVPPRATSTSNRLNFPTGYELWIPREASPRLTFGVLTRDLSRQDQALGVQLPVVRERDLFKAPFSILNVPADPRYRVALRVYRLDGGTEADVKFVTQANNQVLATATFTLTQVDDESYTAAYIDVLTAFPQLAGKGDLRIEITPPLAAYPGAWAFVSVTNNETQHVTVVQPQ